MKKHNHNPEHYKYEQLSKRVTKNPVVLNQLLTALEDSAKEGIEKTYLSYFIQYVEKYGNQLGRKPRHPKLTIDQLLSLKPEGITDTLLMPAENPDDRKPALFHTLDPERVRRDGEIYIIPRPLLSAKLDGFFANQVANYNKLVERVGASSQTYNKLAGGTYERYEKQERTLDQDNAQYDICHSAITKNITDFAAQFAGYAIHPGKYTIFKKKINDLGCTADKIEPQSNEQEKNQLTDIRRSLKKWLSLTDFHPFTDSQGLAHFIEGYFNDKEEPQFKYVSSERALECIILLQDLSKDLSRLESRLKQIEAAIRERDIAAELAKQATRHPVIISIPQKSSVEEDEPKTKTVFKRWQLPTTSTDMVTSAGSSKDSDSKYYVFKGINLGPDPIVVENAVGFNGFYYLDRKALDSQNFDYSAFVNLSRIKFAPEEAQAGIKKITLPMKLRWSFNGVEQEPVNVGHELKILDSADRILLAEIPGEDNEVLYVGLVGVQGGLHLPAQRERVVKQLKNQVFEISSPFAEETPKLGSQKLNIQ